MSRTMLIAGNWKMHMSPSQTQEFLTQLHYAVKDIAGVDIAVAPPFTSLDRASGVLENSPINLCAQNIHYETKGAFTGEISAEFLKEMNVDGVILGHSERRHYFGETDELINQKVGQALKYGLTAFLCIGETLEERESGVMQRVLATQLISGLNGISERELEKVVIAYEPVWAIGTGKSASVEQVDEVHQFLRGVISEVYSEVAASKIRILYGGSVKPSNAKELLDLEDVDGALVGGASLKILDFLGIIKSL
jgi:triosephosphate isomerase (TIM)